MSCSFDIFFKSPINEPNKFYNRYLLNKKKTNVFKQSDEIGRWFHLNELESECRCCYGSNFRDGCGEKAYVNCCCDGEKDQGVRVCGAEVKGAQAIECGEISLETKEDCDIHGWLS